MKVVRIVFGMVRCIVKSGLGSLCDNFAYINEWRGVVPTGIIVPVVLGVSTKKEQSDFQYYIHN